MMDFDGDDDVDLYDEATFGMIQEDQAEEEASTDRRGTGRGGCGCATALLALAIVAGALTTLTALQPSENGHHQSRLRPPQLRTGRFTA